MHGTNLQSPFAAWEGLAEQGGWDGLNAKITIKTADHKLRPLFERWSEAAGERYALCRTVCESLGGTVLVGLAIAGRSGEYRVYPGV